MPKLAAGQIAPGIAAKAAAHARSAEARLRLLSATQELVGQEGASEASSNVFARFQTLEQCAQWSSPEDGIAPMSIKTLRKYFEASGRTFDEIKSTLHSSTSRSAEAEPASSDGASIAKAEAQVDNLLLLTAQYLDLLERLQRVRGRIEEIDFLLKAHFQIYDQPPGPKPKLRVIK